MSLYKLCNKLCTRFCLLFVCFLIVSTSGYTLQCVRPRCGYSLAEFQMPRMNTHHLMGNFTPRRCLRPVKVIQYRGLSTHSLVLFEKKLFNSEATKIHKRWYTQDMSNEAFKIDAALARELVASQFPQWKDLPVMPIAVSGWDNRTFHLGKEMLIRMPSGMEYASKVDKEQKWLPRLAPLLPLAIPEPLGMGHPDERYPCKWSIYRWIDGDTAAFTPITDMDDLADRLAKFIIALQKIDTTDGPLPNFGNFSFIGGLSAYDEETRQAIEAMKNKIDVDSALGLWEKALQTQWQKPPVWVHGDISAGNLLVQNGKLNAVIDFGGLSVGDPACDLVIAWKFFRGKNREIFRQGLPLDSDTWTRGGAWALWKALIVWAGFVESNIVESTAPWRTVEEVLEDYKSHKI